MIRREDPKYKEYNENPPEYATQKEIDDLKKLQKEIQQLKEENEILKKAMHFSNKNHK